MFPPKSRVLPAYHKSMTVPLRLTVFARHRSVSTTLPSRIRSGTPSARARSSCSCSPGARAASTSINLVQVPVRGGLRQPEATAEPRDIALIPEPRQGEQRLPVAAQPPGSLPRADLAAADGQQPGNEPD